ncbi:hypothetical protein LMG28688_06469 [Paraburkholderia caffeinitolerans]|uniref:VOC domain-containing protein n=2 Tax=Burkholderiaceae TaxID=119060 RepID=A0A6J5GUA6_9BURK|nr:hypothetical protein LMG28688_06469 [Paraburkholderia caffeinitolerans]
MPLVHVIKKDHVPSTGEYCPYVHIFFRMYDGSHIAFFDLGDGTRAEPSGNTPAWVNHIALRVDNRQRLEEMKARLLDHGVEVLGVVDHDGYIESIYFFDPNGFRLELTIEVAPSEVIQAFATHAHQQLAEWTAEANERKKSAKETA